LSLKNNELDPFNSLRPYIKDEAFYSWNEYFSTLFMSYLCYLLVVKFTFYNYYSSKSLKDNSSGLLMYLFIGEKNYLSIISY
jgi:hypothetical protein